jgi:hypothetical protein
VDPIVLAAGTALVGAIATTSWQQVCDAAAALWRRVHPQQAEAIGAELDELRQQVVLARRLGDTDTEKALEGTWQVKLQQLLRASPNLAAELQSFLDQVLIPALTPSEQNRIGTIIMTGSSHDSSTFNQIGIQTRHHEP